MSDLFGPWYSDTVDTFTTGVTDSDGITPTTTFTGIPCAVDEVLTQVITAAGTEVRTTSVLYAAYADRTKFTPGTEVTMPDGRVARVASVSGVAAATDDDLDGITVRLA